MADTSLFYWNPKFGKTQPRELVLIWEITGAKTVAQVPVGTPVYTTFDAIASQSTIDDFLNTTDEFTIAQFDATAMGNDAFGCIVNMGSLDDTDQLGQAKQVLGFEIKCFSGSGFTTLVERASLNDGLTASTLETAIAIGEFGNIAFKVDFGNTPDFDGLTSGMIVARIYWISK
jgi:hypothetical protein